MNNSFYVYNNEALVIAVIRRLLNEEKQINISRLFIFVSFLLQDKLISDISMSRYDHFKDYLNKHAKTITQFPKIYLELTPIILNALTLIAEEGLIEILDCNIVSVSNDREEYSCNRLDRIEQVLPHALRLTNQLTDRQLYDCLNIQL